MNTTFSPSVMVKLLSFMSTSRDVEETYCQGMAIVGQRESVTTRGWEFQLAHWEFQCSNAPGNRKRTPLAIVMDVPFGLKPSACNTHFPFSSTVEQCHVRRHSDQRGREHRR